VNALCRYQLADSARSQRWVPSLLVYLIVLWLVYPFDAGPAVPAYGVTAGRVVPDPGMADSHDAEHPGPGRPADHRGHRPWSTAGPSGVVGLRGRRDPAVHRPGHRLGRVANHHNIHGWHAWLGGVGVHLVFGLLGVGLGALLAPPILHRPGPAVLGVVAVTLLSIVIRVSPVAGALDVLTRNPRQGFTAAVAAPVTVLCGLAAVAILASLATARRS